MVSELPSAVGGAAALVGRDGVPAQAQHWLQQLPRSPCKLCSHIFMELVQCGT